MLEELKVHFTIVRQDLPGLLVRWLAGALQSLPQPSPLRKLDLQARIWLREDEDFGEDAWNTLDILLSDGERFPHLHSVELAVTVGFAHEYASKENSYMHYRTLLPKCREKRLVDIDFCHASWCYE